MAEVHPIEQDKIIAFVKDYLDVINTNVIEISHKRNTLKAKVKLISVEHKIPKDFANFISLFLMVTKFIQVENKIWKVNPVTLEKIDRPGFLARNLFKFLFFTSDYNEYYKSPLVFNTVYANNDFEIINKRRSVIKTLATVMNDDRIVFESLIQTLSKRYAFFREFNNPSKYYYTKGDVFTNKQFVFVFLFKTLNYMGMVHIDKKGKMMSDYLFHITDHGKAMITEYENRETDEKRHANIDKSVIKPLRILVRSDDHQNNLRFMFNQAIPKTGGRKDFLIGIRQNLIRRIQSEKIPNLLV